VQWHDQQVPIPMIGQSAQATTSAFWKDTNGAADAPDVALSPVTIPFAEAYVKKHGVTPAYVGYSAYDMVHVIAEAIERAGGSTDPDKLVTALEATDHVGTMGRIQFYGRDNQFTHAMKVDLGWSRWLPFSGKTANRSACGRWTNAKTKSRSRRSSKR
jgi:branched-chain amino acid transport system substrate-binding protein